MKKLVLYSDQIPGKSDEVDKALVRILGKPNPRIAYIPSCSDLSRKYFSQKVEYYNRLGVHDLLYFDIDMEYDPSKINELLSCDGIHLSGGDTVYFLRSLRKRGFLDIIKEYVYSGGVLIGVSAGSMLMAGNISVVRVLNESGMEICGNDSLGLVDFTLIPHWEKNQEYLESLIEYSRESKTTLYACKDSDGIVVDGNKTSFIGEIVSIKNGIVY